MFGVGIRPNSSEIWRFRISLVRMGFSGVLLNLVFWYWFLLVRFWNLIFGFSGCAILGSGPWCLGLV